MSTKQIINVLLKSALLTDHQIIFFYLILLLHFHFAPGLTDTQGFVKLWMSKTRETWIAFSEEIQLHYLGEQFGNSRPHMSYRESLFVVDKKTFFQKKFYLLCVDVPFYHLESLSHTHKSEYYLTKFSKTCTKCFLVLWTPHPAFLCSNTTQMTGL